MLGEAQESRWIGQQDGGVENERAGGLRWGGLAFFRPLPGARCGAGPRASRRRIPAGQESGGTAAHFRRPMCGEQLTGRFSRVRASGGWETPSHSSDANPCQQNRLDQWVAVRPSEVTRRTHWLSTLECMSSFSEPFSQEIAFKLTAAQPERCGFFFDFDGTLAPIQDDPDTVEPVAGVLDALTELGRRVHEVADRFRPPGGLPPRALRRAARAAACSGSTGSRSPGTAAAIETDPAALPYVDAMARAGRAGPHRAAGRNAGRIQAAVRVAALPHGARAAAGRSSAGAGPGPTELGLRAQPRADGLRAQAAGQPRQGQRPARGDGRADLRLVLRRRRGRPQGVRRARRARGQRSGVHRGQGRGRRGRRPARS